MLKQQDFEGLVLPAKVFKKAKRENAEIVICIEPALLLYEARTGNKLSVEKIAQIMGASTTTVYRYKNGITGRPDLLKISKLAKFMGCRPEKAFIFEISSNE